MSIGEITNRMVECAGNHPSKVSGATLMASIACAIALMNLDNKLGPLAKTACWGTVVAVGSFSASALGYQGCKNRSKTTKIALGAVALVSAAFVGGCATVVYLFSDFSIL